MKWKCGDCGKKYATEELVNLKLIKAVEKDTNPKKQHGYISVCTCGYIFHRDRWRIFENFEIPINFLQAIDCCVSTIDLELDHSGCWYETMVFVDSGWKCYYQTRCVTRAEARIEQRRIVKMIKNKQYKLDKKNKELILEVSG